MTAFVDLTRSARRPTTGARRLPAIRAGAALARTVLLWPARALANRQLLNRMGAMSDHELKDIGLHRADLADSTALPLSSEVGSFLATRARARRQAFARRAD